MWNTRWSTNENNCNFFKYKDCFYEFCNSNTNIDFVYRPHPQAFLEWNATGEFTKEEQIAFREKYEKTNNMHIDESKNYYDLLFSSDLLISDYSSLILDYLITKKPIIYCEQENCKMIGDIGNVKEALYIVHNWDELVNTIEELIIGNDPLKMNRIKYRKQIKDKNNNPAYDIVNTIYMDANK